MKQITVYTLAAVFMGCVASFSQAQPTAQVYTPIEAIPPNAQSTPARPAIMLNMSKDHQLFYRAYNEYSDYNGDGQPDGGYLHSTTRTYSGYFDPMKCYTYSASDERFSPSAMADRNNYCNGSSWSGNFLNWATMTRMDIVRKVLYGGYRSTDGGAALGGTSLTVLERASLPMDAHSFAKYYNGSDIARLTPFAETEITLCNTTVDDNNGWSHLTTQPPLLRAARGNYALWNAHERRQCRWNEETFWDNDGSGNGNTLAITGLAASGDYPRRATQALAGGSSGDFVVRVEVCNSSLLGSERCRRYPNGNHKPIGLLQEYGESDRVEFGLITGSFSRNISGGVLRKNLSSFRDEVNAASDGTFTSVVGIAGTLNRIRIWGYRYSDSSYSADNSDARFDDGNCTFQLSGLTDNRCASWGNPIGEMFTEALRYLKGPLGSGTYGPAAAYGGGADVKGDILGLPRPAWVDPFRRGSRIDTVFGLPQCRPINAINFNASVISYDNDTQGPFADLGAAASLNTYIDAVGLGEGINGTSRFVGRVNGAGDSSCTAKTVGTLSQVDGLCPTGPAYRGSFALAGDAYWAHTNPIRDMRPDFPLTSRLYGTSKDPNFRVDTFSVALAPGLPRIEIRAPAGTAIIQPNYVLNRGGVKAGNGTLVDFRVVSQTATSGKYLVVWEDSEQGGDYDQDASGILEWSLSGNTLKITTSTFADATNNPQGFGYTISGTSKDGVHYHSGILNFSFNDPTNLVVTQVDGVTPHPQINSTGGCQGCRINQLPSQATYTVTGGSGLNLEDPLFYAAKWGGYNFASGGSPDLPDSASKWDSRNGQGLAVSDGVPDNYFLVFNPDQLETALRRVFGAIVATSNAAPAVSSGQLVAGELKYAAEFSQNTVSGDVKAFRVSATGFSTTPTWRLGERLASARVANRQIITNDGAEGVAFDWATLSARPTYLSMLTGGVTPVSSADAPALVDYLRGDRSRESGLAPWRVRPADNIVGPIVNGAPWIQDRPMALFFSATHFPGYRDFLLRQKARTKLLWAASNDGMLHGVRADDGTPVLSYVPGMLAPRLVEQTQTGLGVRAFVDGSPFTGDVGFPVAGTGGAPGTTDWRTYLFGSLGRGGRGLYALDVTNASNLTAGRAASIFKWQFTADDDADLGYVVSDVSVKRSTNQATPIAKLNNGKFAIIMGNGYQSTSGKAALMILPAEGPAAGNWVGRYTKLVADNGTGNGLSTATWVDLDNNGTADVVYAGDLRGNLWKFDISSTNPTDWRVAYGGEPLYIATNAGPLTPRLPISAAPEVTFPAFGGVMVTFATGLSNTAAEFPRVDVRQRMYGIWDRAAFGSTTPATRRSLPRGDATLVARIFTRDSDGNVSVPPSAEAIDYQNAVARDAKDGWYAVLPGTSEMVVSNPVYFRESIFMVSIRPNSSDSCDGLPVATLYVFDPMSGVPSTARLGVVSSGGVLRYRVGITIMDQKVVIVSDATGRPTTQFSGEVSGVGGVSDGTANPENDSAEGAKGSIVLPNSPRYNRIQWREIPGLRTYVRP